MRANRRYCIQEIRTGHHIPIPPSCMKEHLGVKSAPDIKNVIAK